MNPKVIMIKFCMYRNKKHISAQQQKLIITYNSYLVNVSLSYLNLLLIFSFVLAELGTLEVGLDSQPKLPELPGLTNVVVP